MARQEQQGHEQRRRPRRPPRRDRRGRGLRGPLAPPDLPVSLTRSEQFDELVVSSLARLERRWGEQLDGIEVVVADVPDIPDDLAGEDPVSGSEVALGRAEPARDDQPARIVVHRRAVEARAKGLRERESLVHEVMVRRLAELLGLDAAVVDPDAEDDRGEA